MYCMKDDQSYEHNVDTCPLKGHSQLCDCADLDTSFSHFEKSLQVSL